MPRFSESDLGYDRLGGAGFRSVSAWSRILASGGGLAIRLGHERHYLAQMAIGLPAGTLAFGFDLIDMLMLNLRT